MTNRRPRRAALAGAAVALATIGLTGCAAQTSSMTDASPAASGAGDASGAPTAAAGIPQAVLDSTRLDDIQAEGKLDVCTTGDYRPYTYLDPATGEYSGIDVEMAKDLAAELGVEINWVQTTWKTLMDDFTTSCDIGVGGISITTARATTAYFSSPTMIDGKTPITLCENVDKYDTIEEINQPDVTSIMPEGGTNQKFADANYPNGNRVTFHDNNAIFDEIIAGRADVMTTDASEAVWVAHEKPQLCAVHPAQPFSYAEKGYLLPLGDQVFQEYVDQWLHLAMHDGTYEGFKTQWFGAGSGI